MEANELRIGNYVSTSMDGKKIYLVEEIKMHGLFISNQILITDIGEVQYHNIYPIPLSEGWLPKLGFEKWPSRNTFEWKDGDYRSIQIEIKKSTFEIYLCGCYSATSQECFPVDDIKYVHQLQNLYFALTGKELTLKENK